MASPAISPYRRRLSEPAQDPNTVPGDPRINDYEGGFTNTNDPRKMMEQNRMNWEGKGDTIARQTSATTTDLGNQVRRYRGAGDAAADELQETPGYTRDEGDQINVDYNQFNTPQGAFDEQGLTPNEVASINGNPHLRREALNPQIHMDIDKTSADAQNQGVRDLKTGLKDAYDPQALKRSATYMDETSGALAGQEGGVNSAIGSEEASLDQINDPSKLGVSGDFINRYRMSDQDVNDLETQAGRSEGLRYQNAQDTLNRDAFAEGNTSPAALAAARARLLTQEGSATGDAAANARIQAKNTQAAREKEIEDARRGSEGDIATRRSNAATTVGQQKIAGAENLSTNRLKTAGESENTRMSGERDVADRNTGAAITGNTAAIEVADRTGKEAQDTSRFNENARVGVEKDIDDTTSNRAAQIAGNRQNTTTRIADTKFAQDTGSAQNTAAGAKTVGDARIAGNKSYRDYVQGQQQGAQAGQLTSSGQQIQNYATQGGLVNEATQQKGTQDLGQSAANTNKVKAIGGIAADFLEDGGVVTEPGVYTIGEQGPEQVVPMEPDAGGTFVSSYQDRAEANPDQMAHPGSHKGPSLLQRAGAGIQRYRNTVNSMRPVRNRPRMMADGGIVTKPTQVVLGECGPEAVVPLTDRPNAKLTPGMIERYRKPSSDDINRVEGLMKYHGDGEVQNRTNAPNHPLRGPYMQKEADEEHVIMQRAAEEGMRLRRAAAR